LVVEVAVGAVGLLELLVALAEVVAVIVMAALVGLQHLDRVMLVAVELLHQNAVVVVVEGQEQLVQMEHQRVVAMVVLEQHLPFLELEPITLVAAGVVVKRQIVFQQV
jgi:hypothetical protein